MRQRSRRIKPQPRISRSQQQRHTHLVQPKHLRDNSKGRRHAREPSRESSRITRARFRLRIGNTKALPQRSLRKVLDAHRPSPNIPFRNRRHHSSFQRTAEAKPPPNQTRPLLTIEYSLSQAANRYIFCQDSTPETTRRY